MAELKLGYNPYYYFADYRVYNGLESSKRISGSNEQDFCGMSWNHSAYANKSDANIITGIKISYRRKYAKDDSAALSGSVKYFFYPYAIASPSVSGNQISGNRGKLSTNTQSVEFRNTSWSGIETKTLATDAATYSIGFVRQNNYYLTVFCTIKRMSGTLGHRGYIKEFSGTLVYTPRYYARFRNSDGSVFESIRAITCNSGEIPTSPTPPQKDGYTFKGWTRTQGGTVAEPLVAGHDEDIYWYAVYEKNAYAITASAGAGGTISPSGSTQVSYGNSQTYTITPNDGYEIDTVTVDGVNKGAVSSYTFSNVTAAHTISVSFKQVEVKPPEFTSASLTYAGSQVSASNKVPAGESCILSVGVS